MFVVIDLLFVSVSGAAWFVSCQLFWASALLIRRLFESDEIGGEGWMGVESSLDGSIKKTFTGCVFVLPLGLGRQSGQNCLSSAPIFEEKSERKRDPWPDNETISNAPEVVSVG